ncbi:glycosyltransferase [Kineococcus rhizosphaerae]|uniref:MGT family glycosyltransferase n=1 Tax=Kineococcus rhizosphaerae TaxID=559628 RepID=A0A2T0QZI0_9ACTN|nr:nucleotide disphospho-sugar-binding domain-containing protein [Kineococcus rhizosphaerae]PRY12099.1 MGT family glycosyltransferase [Kineococcus rhizosphaerae]
MPHHLVLSSPIHGHVAPALAVTRGLLARGHEVTVLTGRKYAGAVAQAGAEFLALPAEVDYDDADLDAWLPGRQRKKGLAAVRHDLIGMFVRPIPVQARAVAAELARHRYDTVVAESAFLGVLPLLLSAPAGQRIPVVGISAIPVTLTSVDAAPFGPALAPGTTALHRLRNRLLTTVVHAGPFRPVQRAADAALAEVGAPPMRGNFFDQSTGFDVTFQLSARGLEYPRRELPDSVRFVGPLRPGPSSASVPPWWADVEDARRAGRPVVHVTQGTIDNTDFGRLVVPTLRALADDDVLVVATTGGRPLHELTTALGGDLPANARAAEFLSYPDLLPRTDVVVTNGGFGGVQQALAAGVPLVVAGSTEDKPEVAARVAWAGAGVDLRSGSPRPDRVAAAVRRVLQGAAFRTAAARLQREIEGYGDPLETITRELERRAESHRAPA